MNPHDEIEARLNIMWKNPKLLKIVRAMPRPKKDKRTQGGEEWGDGTIDEMTPAYTIHFNRISVPCSKCKTEVKVIRWDGRRCVCEECYKLQTAYPKSAAKQNQSTSSSQEEIII